VVPDDVGYDVAPPTPLVSISPEEFVMILFIFPAEYTTLEHDVIFDTVPLAPAGESNTEPLKKLAPVLASLPPAVVYPKVSPAACLIG
jgi:hypothetical protein